MGFHVSWIATKGIEKQTVLDQFELAATGEFDAVPDSKWSFLDIRNGWCVFIWNETESLDETAKKLSGLTPDAVVITAMVAESAMVCVCAGWSGGNKNWEIEHDAQKELTHLRAEGNLPPSFEKFKAEYSSLQIGVEDVDYYFEIPLRVAQSICGYMHDQTMEHLGDTPFEILKSNKPEVPQKPKQVSAKVEAARAHANKYFKGQAIYEKRKAAGKEPYMRKQGQQKTKKTKSLLGELLSFFNKKD